MRGASGADAVRVAEVVLSPSETERIAAIAAELEGVAADLLADCRARLSHDHWRLLEGYAAACVRRALEVGSMLHGVAAAADGCGVPHAGRGRDGFVRAALAAWRECYAPVPEVWRLAPVFAAVEGGERRVLAEVATLEAMAANRMFASLDEQWAALHDSGA